VKQKKRKINVSSHDRRRESNSLKKRLNARLHEKLNEHRKQKKPHNARNAQLKRGRNVRRPKNRLKK
jgi:hypothetical protein